MNQERIKKDGNEVEYWLEMRLCMFPRISSHSWLDYHQPIFRNLICSNATDQKERWTRRFEKVDFYQSDRCLTITTSRLREQVFFPVRSLKTRPDPR